MKAKTIRCGSGLGDSIYLQSVVRHLISKGQKITAASNYPDVFKFTGCDVIPFTRNNIDIIAHYSMRRFYKDTTQFKDCCLQAGITEKVDLKLEWETVNYALIDELKSNKKPILLVQMARNPMDRRDAFGMDLLPKCEVIQALIDLLKESYLIVLIGAGRHLYQFNHIDIDLTNKTTISDVLDLGLNCDAMLGYCSFMIPLAESFDKPALMVWARKGLKSPEQVIRSITPEKIIYKPSTSYIFDDATIEQLTDKANEFCK